MGYYLFLNIYQAITAYVEPLYGCFLQDLLLIFNRFAINDALLFLTCLLVNQNAMIVKNRLHSAFGSTGTTAGYILLFVGAVTTFTYPAAILLAVFGAFMAFTYSCTFVDMVGRRAKFTNMIFGVIPYGDWIPITYNMQLGIKKSKRLYTTYSRGNRELNIEKIDYCIILYNSLNSPIITMAMFPTPELARAEADNLMSKLGLKSID